jgi:hypothetical protein
MHKEILSKNQIDLLPYLKQYKTRFYLVGGTAIAFYLGHRESLDFDLFRQKSFNNSSLKKEINDWNFDFQIIAERPNQIHFIVNSVKITFFEFPYEIESNTDFENVFRLPDLLTLASMKAFALGGRAKWKDYIDLYFIIKDHYSIDQISTKAKELFKSSFNPLLFKKQLCFFDDVNYSETPIFLSGFEVSEEEVRNFLIEVAIG